MTLLRHTVLHMYLLIICLIYMGVGGEKGETSGRAPYVTEFGSRRKHRRAQRSFSVITLFHYQYIMTHYR